MVELLLCEVLQSLLGSQWLHTQSQKSALFRLAAGAMAHPILYPKTRDDLDGREC